MRAPVDPPAAPARIVHVGFTGTQVGTTEAQRRRLAAGIVWAANTRSLPIVCDVEFGHGVCIGADDEIATLASTLPCVRSIREFPPTNAVKMATPRYHGAVQVFREPPAPYLKRNHAIVNWCHVLFAAPREMEGSTIRSGTWATVRYALRRGVEVFVIRPDGRVQRRRAAPAMHR